MGAVGCSSFLVLTIILGVVVVIVVGGGGGIFTQSVQGLPLHLYPLSQSHTASRLLEQFTLYSISRVKAAYITQVDALVIDLTPKIIYEVHYKYKDVKRKKN